MPGNSPLLVHSMVLSIFTELCNHHHNLSLEHFHRPRKKPPEAEDLKAPGSIPGRQSAPIGVCHGDYSQ